MKAVSVPLRTRLTIALAAAMAVVLAALGAFLYAPMLRPIQLAAVSGPAFFTARVSGVDDPVRLLAVRQPTRDPPLFVVVGATLGDRNEALGRLLVLLAIAGPLALGVVSWAGWLLSGAALRPVERMRVEAAAISRSEPEHRLEVPSTRDELARLATTLNTMLDRVQDAADRDRQFLDQASHELRTPLTVLKTELDLALSRPRSTEELEQALLSVSAETDRLLRLAEDLLVRSRSLDGTLAVRRAAVALPALVEEVCGAYQARAGAAGVRLSHAEPEVAVSVDAVRIRQALEDLLDNALRYGSDGGEIRVEAALMDGSLELIVQDSGRGFTEDELGSGRTGLGLSIARAIAQAHGGTLTLGNLPQGGAMVSLLIPL